jgi:hydroxyethylthiazole kinase-like uncharacterized protein yjeF
VPEELTPARLRDLTPPPVDADASKHDRGTVAVIGGTAETPGAVLLAGIAALRAGAGRVRVATDPACAVEVGVAFPEARVFTFDDAPTAGVVLIGPGIIECDDSMLERTIDDLDSRALLLVDAGALASAGRHPEWIRQLDGRCALLPNPDEMALLGVEDVRSAAERFGAVVAARGPDTWIAAPDGSLLVDRHGGPGLATSGSGDVASGLAAGFSARGADPVAAVAWAAAVHGRAGERLGGVGFLARELLDEVRPAIADLLAFSGPGSTLFG